MPTLRYIALRTKVRTYQEKFKSLDPEFRQDFGRSASAQSSRVSAATEPVEVQSNAQLLRSRRVNPLSAKLLSSLLQESLLPIPWRVALYQWFCRYQTANFQCNSLMDA